MPHPSSFDAAPPPPGQPASLLSLLIAAPGSGPAALVVLPPPAVEPAAALPDAAPLARWWRAPLVRVARAVLRRPKVRQVTLRILKRAPALYARTYRMMLAPGVGATPRDDGGLSARAAAILDALRTLPPSGDLGRRRRLALVAPLPPQRSGIASYTVDLLVELARHMDITLVVDQAEVALPPTLAGLPVQTSAWFAEHGGLFDQVLYQFGNSPLHSHMFALLARHPGVVVLHDFFLGGSLAHAQMSGALPGAWSDALLHAHGYGAVRAITAPGRHALAHQEWPSSLGILDMATRVIVHSRHARQLAIDWFGGPAAHNIDVIPLPRAAPPVIDRAAARAALGIADDCFLVCSFGFIAPNKLTQALLRAWLSSALRHDPSCMLVLVGANHDSPYGVAVTDLIREAGPGARIQITGWSGDARYRNYLQAADVGIQLRSHARGESSAAVLDCLNYGVPAIVNANGSMAELPADTVVRLPDVFDDAELSAALEALWRDPARRRDLRRRALDLMDTQFRPAECVRQYLHTLDQAQAQTAARRQHWRTALASATPGSAPDLRRLAAELAQQEAPATVRQLLVDVSNCAGHPPDPLAAGQLRELLQLASAGLRIEPVWLDTAGATPVYRQARNATGRLLGLTWPHQYEPVVDMHRGDIFYAPDAASAAVLAAAEAGLLAELRARGVAVNMLVRSMPDGAPPRAAASADRLLCMSADAARQLEAHRGRPEATAYNSG